MGESWESTGWQSGFEGLTSVPQRSFCACVRGAWGKAPAFIIGYLLKAGIPRSTRGAHTHFIDRKMALYLRNSAARRTFKKTLGNANHHIVTAMVGLDAIERGIVTEAPDGFPARWNPRSQSTSARRSRRLILEMALVRSVDALDTYFSWTNRKPFLIQDKKFKAELDGMGRSVSGKFRAFERYAKPSDDVLSALVATSIGWRNKAVHSQDEDRLRYQVVVVLEQNAEEIRDRFRGLEVDELLDGYG